MVGALSIYSIVLFLTKRSIAANLAHLRQDYDDDMYKSHAFRMESNQSDTISTSVDPRPLNLTHSLGELNVPPPKRLVVSLTTTRKRINQPEMKNVLRRASHMFLTTRLVCCAADGGILFNRVARNPQGPV